MLDHADEALPEWPAPSTALVIGARERQALRALCIRAAANPITVGDLKATLTDRDAKAEHVERVSSQTVYLPAAFMVSLTVEVQAPGLYRHLCVSIHAGSGIAHPAAVWMIAEELGFVGSMRECIVYPETLRGHGFGVNVLQPVDMPAPAPVDG